MAHKSPTKMNVNPTSSSQQSTDELSQSCPICLDTFNKEDCRQVFTSCGHSFCQNCLQRTLNIKPFCPLCRQYQQPDNPNHQHSHPPHLDRNTPWDPQVVRAYFSETRLNENGSPMRTVRLSNGELTNIHVSPGVKIRMSPDTNIVINGKRIQNPTDCNQQ